jgi:phospholipid/cholesterol/gamma-HCH transport system permease protein
MQGYVNETMTSVHVSDVATGLWKSLSFSIGIGLIACQKGFSAKDGPDGVGRCTTSAVVTSLFTIILFDALFTVVFRALNL